MDPLWVLAVAWHITALLRLICTLLPKWLLELIGFMHKNSIKCLKMHIKQTHVITPLLAADIVAALC